MPPPIPNPSEIILPMHRFKKVLLVHCLFAMGALPCCPATEPVTPKGKAVISKLEAMGVDKLWLAGAIVDWKTGLPTGKPVTDPGKHTHCSQFAAAACDLLGVYLLRPPEHSPVLLANAQFDWLGSKAGETKGWTTAKDGVAAQDQANQGNLVVAVYKNKDPQKPGHIAIVRPGEKSPEEIAKEGPDVIQAGGTNYIKTSLRKGFANHKQGYDEIGFFYHAVDLVTP